MAKHNYSCGSIIPSSCVPYTGSKLKFLSDDEQPECDDNINDVITKIGDAIDAIKKATDVATHSMPCVTLSSAKTVSTVLQDHSDKICALNASISALAEQLASFNAATELVTIDLGCLSAGASPCEVNTNTYTIISLLNLFKTEICAIKSNLGI